MYIEDGEAHLSSTEYIESLGLGKPGLGLAATASKQIGGAKHQTGCCPSTGVCEMLPPPPPPPWTPTHTTRLKIKTLPSVRPRLCSVAAGICLLTIGHLYQAQQF
jgi:hypothetical protein